MYLVGSKYLILILAENIFMRVVVLFWFLSIQMSAQISVIKLKKASLIANEIIFSKLNNDDISSGLKEALRIGVDYSVNMSSKNEGFYKNSFIKIPFPKEANKIKETFFKFGMQSKVEAFEYIINEAASDASILAKDIFIEEINNIRINDALSILKGKDNAATTYLKNNTTKQLYAKFKPVIINSINKTKLLEAWEVLLVKYNSLPFTKNINVDLEKYVTKKTLEGLFKLIEKEEMNIRTNPKARVTENLQKIFK